MRWTIMASLVFVSTATAAQDKAIVKEVVVNGPPAEVWKAWTTSEGIATFFAPFSNIELRPGGRYDILFSKAAPAGLRGAEGCQVLSYIPERMLSFSWNSPPTLPLMRLRNTFVVLEMAPFGEHTRVTLTNGGYGKGEDWDKAYAYFDNAWSFVLGSLEKRFKEGPRTWPADEAPSAEALKSFTLGGDVLKDLLAFIGGRWVGEVKGPEGPLKVEFTYKKHPDGIGMLGSGVIGKGSKNPTHISSSYGIDPLTGSAYYLDSHNSGTVYFGHLTRDAKDFVFVFGNAGGRQDRFMSRGRFRDKDTYESIIRQADGSEIVGLVLRRVR